MPELPEVEMIVRQLAGKLTGRTISRVWSRPHAVLTTAESKVQEHLPGRVITSVQRKGKYLHLALPENLRLWFHLGMTGQLLLKSPQNQPDRHVHFILFFTKSLRATDPADGRDPAIGGGGSAAIPEIASSPVFGQDPRNDRDFVLWFRDIRKFGEVFMTFPNQPLPKSLAKLAPDPFEMSDQEWFERIKNRKAPIKSLLLNQQVISGIGNIYANESLYRAGINPRKSASKLKKEAAQRLFNEIRLCLQESIECGGSSIDDYRQTDGSRGTFQTRHQIYGRFEKSCLRCGQLIRRITQSGRSTYYCSNCQA